MVEQRGLASRLGAEDGDNVVGKSGGQQILGGEVERELGSVAELAREKNPKMEKTEGDREGKKIKKQRREP